MIVFLTISYIAILGLLIKLKVIKPTLGWKLSPIAWMALLLIALFIPMQFWAPSGTGIVIQYSVPIVSNVSGQVTEVAVEPNKPMKKGEILFKLDPTQYQAAYDQVAAQLELAKTRLKKTEDLRSKDAVSIYELEQFQAQVKQLEAGLAAAKYNLDQTTARAPSDGFATNVALRPGARVGALPFSPTMSFVEDSTRVIGAQIPQGYLRLIEPGQSAEITFKLYPGKIYNATVEYVIPATATGQIATSGAMFTPREIVAAPFAVRIKLEDDTLMNSLPAGAVGSVAIYTGSGAATHVIRKVMIRMDAYMNYLIPY